MGSVDRPRRLLPVARLHDPRRLVRSRPLIPWDPGGLTDIDCSPCSATTTTTSATATAPPSTATPTTSPSNSPTAPYSTAHPTASPDNDDNPSPANSRADPEPHQPPGHRPHQPRPQAPDRHPHPTRTLRRRLTAARTIRRATPGVCTVPIATDASVGGRSCSPHCGHGTSKVEEALPLAQPSGSHQRGGDPRRRGTEPADRARGRRACSASTRGPARRDPAVRAGHVAPPVVEAVAEVALPGEQLMWVSNRTGEATADRWGTMSSSGRRWSASPRPTGSSCSTGSSHGAPPRTPWPKSPRPQPPGTTEPWLYPSV